MRRERRRQSKRSSKVLAFLKGVVTNFNDRSELADYVRFRLTAGSDQVSKLYTDMNPKFSDENKLINRSSEDRKSEVIADKFPTIYGYSTNIVKVVYALKDIRNNKAYEIARRKGNDKQRKNNFNISLLNIKQVDIDEYPHTIQRVHVALNTLEAEYNKENIDPKVKAELKRQIDQIRKHQKKLRQPAEAES